jgi:hypothetical protein
MAILGRGQPNPPYLSRNSLQDDAVLTTPAAIVQAAPRHPAFLPPPTSPILQRSSFQDVQVVMAATPGPIVVAAATPLSRFTPGPLILDRGTLQDDPVLTTTPPVVVDAPRHTAWGPPPTSPILSRSSLEDVAVVPTAATPEPIVVTPPPVIPVRQPPILSRSSFEDIVAVTATTPAPIVIVPVPGRRWPTQAILLRAHLQDPPVLTTPAPIVIMAPRWRNPTYPLLFVAPVITGPPPVFDANGRVVVTQTVTSSVDAGGTSGLAGVNQATSSTVAVSPDGGAVSVDPTVDGRAEAG